MNAAGLGNVVGGLLLGVVGNMARHGGGDYKRAGAALLKVVADGFGAIEGAGEIGGNDFLPILYRAVKDTGVGGTAGIGYEAVDLYNMLISLSPSLLYFDTASRVEKRRPWAHTLPNSLMTSATNFSQSL